MDTTWTQEVPIARTVRDANLESRTARSRLRARGKPYYKGIEPGVHLGYRKPLSGSGRWIARHRAGQGYQVEVIAVADDYSDPDGVAVLSFAQAQAKARDRMVARAHQAAGKHHGPYTVADAMDAYLAFLNNNRKSGADARQRDAALIRPVLGTVKVADLTTDKIRDWLNELAKTPARLRTRPGAAQQYAPLDDAEAKRARKTTANRTFTILKAALNMAWRNGKAPSNTAWSRVERFEGVDSARIRYLDVAEAQRLVNACEGGFRLLVQAGLATGARLGDLTSLRVHDFNRDAGTLTIRQGKGNKVRHVILTAEGVALFTQLCAGRSGDAIVLLRDDGDPWKKSQQGEPMRLACERAKISPAISYHGLRHTWASLAVMDGMPLMVVAKNLGHRDTKMVEQHYGHLAPSYVADAIRKHAPTFGFTPDTKVSSIR